MKSNLIIFAFLIITSFTIFLSGTGELWIYHYDKIQQGEYWRLLTGHVVHFSNIHLWNDTIGLSICIWLACIWHCSLLGPILFGSFCISAGIFFIDPNMSLYGGLSGIVFCLFTSVCLEVFLQKKRYSYIAGISIIIIFIWLLITLTFSPAETLTIDIFENESVEKEGYALVAVLAHFMGVISALLYKTPKLFRYLKHKKAKENLPFS